MPLTTVGTEVEHFIENKLERSGYNVESQVAASGINKDWSRIDLVIIDDTYDFAEAISEFMSTHPSPKNRIQKLKNWIPEVNARFG